MIKNKFKKLLTFILLLLMISCGHFDQTCVKNVKECQINCKLRFEKEISDCFIHSEASGDCYDNFYDLCNCKLLGNCWRR